MSFNFFKNLKIKVLFFIFLIFSFLNISLIPVFALITDGGGGTNQLSFNPNDYEIDYSQRHNSKFWRHEDGHVFASNARMFYDFPGMKMVPCRTYQEYANKPQIASNAINIGLNFFSPAKLFKVIKTGYQIAKEYGGDQICDFKDDGVAMINDIVRYYTLNDQGKAFFFFDPSQLNEIKQVDITFCDCDMSPSFITSVIDFVINLTDFLETANFDELVEKLLLKGEFSDAELVEIGIAKMDLTQKKITKEIQTKIKNYIKKKINQKVGHAIAKTALKKGTKKVVGNTWGKIFFPEVFEAIDMAEKKYESFASKKENILFDIKNNSYEKTLGFVLRFPSKNELKLYELKKDSNNNSVYRLIKRVNFSDSSHMLINLIQLKHGLEMEPQKNLTVYCGKLKK
ncbi:conserved hypothetical protein [Candidatus Phytoplasma mali]|uniref:Uncharacterized protein n=1 Tax=Phytoplasma mali (strain AT) TaxID=482235 RepID=B3R0M9_PHYMT|nr:hypothetical protein [Candidatus Phytoplasma mali]CAP18613.1 conserved hypothetical protein [Candidatus Phytoplasma mali]